VSWSQRPETNHFPPSPLFLGVPRRSDHLEVGAVDIRVEREDGGGGVEWSWGKEVERRGRRK